LPGAVTAQRTLEPNEIVGINEIMEKRLFMLKVKCVSEYGLALMITTETVRNHIIKLIDDPFERMRKDEQIWKAYLESRNRNAKVTRPMVKKPRYRPGAKQKATVRRASLTDTEQLTYKILKNEFSVHE
jgi:hypothetical protein